MWFLTKFIVSICLVTIKVILTDGGVVLPFGPLSDELRAKVLVRRALMSASRKVDKHLIKRKLQLYNTFIKPDLSSQNLANEQHQDVYIPKTDVEFQENLPIHTPQRRSLDEQIPDRDINLIKDASTERFTHSIINDYHISPIKTSTGSLVLLPKTKSSKIPSAYHGNISNMAKELKNNYINSQSDGPERRGGPESAVLLDNKNPVIDISSLSNKRPTNSPEQDKTQTISANRLLSQQVSSPYDILTKSSSLHTALVQTNPVHEEKALTALPASKSTMDFGTKFKTKNKKNKKNRKLRKPNRHRYHNKNYKRRKNRKIFQRKKATIKQTKIKDS